MGGVTMAATLAVGSAVFAACSAAAAWAAILFGRKNAIDAIEAQTNIAARSSRASVVSANRQKWIDALREDLADFLSAVSSAKDLQYSGSMSQSGQDALHAEERQCDAKLRTLRNRIELRLNADEAEHQLLLEALDDHASTYTGTTAQLVLSRAKGILKGEWERLKREAIGVRPIVSSPSTDPK
jgi:hypothetical protein